MLEDDEGIVLAEKPCLAKFFAWSDEQKDEIDENTCSLSSWSVLGDAKLGGGLA